MSITQSVHVAEGSIVKDMESGFYERALVLLAQLEKEYGKLSVQNQLRRIECLFSRNRFMEALDLCIRYYEQGNTTSDILFMKGLCLYHLHQWESATELFASEPSWNLWYRKAALMDKIAKRKEEQVILHDSSAGEQPDNVSVGLSQTNQKLILTFNLKDVPQGHMDVEISTRSIKVEWKEFGSSLFFFERGLYDAIVPAKCEVRHSPEDIVVVLHKREENQWPAYFLPEDEQEKENARDLDSILADLPEIEDFSDDATISMFESTQKETLPPHPTDDDFF